MQRDKYNLPPECPDTLLGDLAAWVMRQDARWVIVTLTIVCFYIVCKAIQ